MKRTPAPDLDAGVVNDHSQQKDTAMDATTQELIAQRLTLYRSLFHGRDDVYAYRWQAADGRSGYSPARNGKDGPYTPLNERVIRAHLGGRTSIGTFPLLPDGTTWILAVDFDGKAGDPLADAQRLIAYCKDWGIPAYLERSRSGAGYHVWTFFSAPIPAWKVRLVALRVLLPEAGVQMDEKAAYDRLFPNQDRHSGKRLGSLVALPLQGERLKHGCTAFLDVSNGLNPYPSQWGFLETIQRTDEAALDAIMQEFGLSEQDAPQTSREAAPGPEEVRQRLAGGFAEGEGRNEAAFTTARRLAAQGMPQEEAQAFMAAWNQSNRPPLDPEELRRTVESAFQRAGKNGRSSGFVSDGPYKNTGPSDGRIITLTPRSAAALMSEAPPVLYRVDQLIPVGSSSVIVADANVGKTWMTETLALSVDQGTPWLGRFQTMPGRTLIIDEENTDALIKKRLGKLLRGAGLPEDASTLNVEFLTGQGINLSDEAYVAALDRVFEAMRPDLIIVDALVRIHRGNENDAGDMARVFGIIKQWISTYGMSFVFCHHRRRPGMTNNDPSNMFRGSSEIRAFTDTMLDLRVVRGEKGVFTVEHTKSRFAEAIEPFNVEIVDVAEGATVVRYAGEPKSQTQEKIKETQEFILSLAADREWHSRQEILDKGVEAGHKRDTLDTARKLLIEAGQVVEERQGKRGGIRLADGSDFVSDGPNTYIGRRKQNEVEGAVFEEVKL